MSGSDWKEGDQFNDKVGAFLETHRRVVEEFRTSLANAQHFIELARLAMEREPENTLIMLEQIKEVDLVRHLNAQMDAFLEVADLVPNDVVSQQFPNREAELEELQHEYERMLEQAEEQLESINGMIEALERIV